MKKQIANLKSLTAGVFIDDANLFYAQKKAGWRIDLKKLRKILAKEVKIAFVNYYLALPASWDNAYKATRNYISKINKDVNVKTKPLKYIRTGNQIIKKGDVDLEIALDVARNLKQLDIVFIVSGDSDYIELRRFLLEQGKKIVFLGFKENMAWEIKQGKYLFLNNLRQFIELNKKTPGYYPGRLLLTILYQKKGKPSRAKVV